MNNALAVTVQVSYYYGSVNLGDWGLEGSKPGAAAAGVMFANRVGVYGPGGRTWEKPGRFTNPRGVVRLYKPWGNGRVWNKL